MRVVDTSKVHRVFVELDRDRKMGFVYFTHKKGARRGTLFVHKPDRVKTARTVVVDVDGGQAGHKEGVILTLDPDDWVYVTLDNAGYAKVRVRLQQVQCANQSGHGRFYFEVQGADQARGR